MKPENAAYLESQYHHWVSVRDTQTLRLLDGITRQKMQDIMREEWEPNYLADLSCTPCVFEHITRVYTRYDEWKASQVKHAEVVSEEPLTVAANFPKHDKPKKKK